MGMWAMFQTYFSGPNVSWIRIGRLGLYAYHNMGNIYIENRVKPGSKFHSWRLVLGLSIWLINYIAGLGQASARSDFDHDPYLVTPI